MGERMEKIKRRNRRWKYIEAFNDWLEEEPPMILFWKWARWKSRRPKWDDRRSR